MRRSNLQAAEAELAAIVEPSARNKSSCASQSRHELDDALSEHEPMRIKLDECVRTATLLDEQIARRSRLQLHDAGANLDECGKRLIGADARARGSSGRS